MKLSDSLVCFIEERLYRYCKQLSINKPTVLTKTREVLDLPKKVTKGRRTSAYRYYGVAYMAYNTVFINVKRNKTRKDLDHTIRHELIHMRFPYLSHGSNFEKKISLLGKGHTWKPSKSKYLDN